MSDAKYSLELRSLGNPFTFEYDFYDEMFRCNFEQKFCDYYAFNEIGFETIERFKHNLKAHLNLKMPYYDQLYRTELAAEELDFLLNKDYRETFIRTVDTEDKMFGTSRTDGTTSSNGSSSDEGTTKGQTTNENSTSGTSRTDVSGAGSENEQVSNVADGVASASLSPQFLTGAGKKDSETTSSEDVVTNGTDHTVINEEGTTTNKRTDESTGTSSQNGNTTEDRNGKLLEKTELIGQGNIGVTSSAELLEKWRKVLINIDEQIILGCQDLFMGVF